MKVHQSVPVYAEIHRIMTQNPRNGLVLDKIYLTLFPFVCISYKNPNMEMLSFFFFWTFSSPGVKGARRQDVATSRVVVAAGGGLQHGGQ